MHGSSEQFIPWTRPNRNGFRTTLMPMSELSTSVRTAETQLPGIAAHATMLTAEVNTVAATVCSAPMYRTAFEKSTATSSSSSSRMSQGRLEYREMVRIRSTESMPSPRHVLYGYGSLARLDRGVFRTHSVII